jgi:hypothetical protein
LAYHIERDTTAETIDIVIDGFEEGIADSPYKGIGDMRNVNVTSVKGEAFCNFALGSCNLPPTITALAFTTNAGTNTATYTGAALYNGCAITVPTQSGAGLTVNRVYWVGNVTATTFQVYTSPSVYVGSLVVMTTGSGTFSTYTVGKMTMSTTDNRGGGYIISGRRYIFFVDNNGRVWWVGNTGGAATTNIIYLGNEQYLGGGANANSGSGIVVMDSWIMVFQGGSIYYLNGTLIENSGFDLYAQWGTFAQSSDATGISNRPIFGTDNVIYFCNIGRLGSIINKVVGSFNPANGATYTFASNALQLPNDDNPTCLGQLGNNLIIGGVQNLVYQWDRKSTSFSYPLVMPEIYSYRIVTTNQNAYIFAGARGRIYVTNGTSINLYKKVPDFTTGTVEPYYIWGDAVYWKNQLYFSFSAYTNADGALTTGGGLWAIDLETEVLRHTQTVSDGSGSVVNVIQPNVMTTKIAGQYTATPAGAGLFAAWGLTGLDVTTSIPYSGGQTRIDSDMVPVGRVTTPMTPSYIEWKATVPIGNNGTAETVALYWRTDLSQGFTLAGSTTSSTGMLSDLYSAGFEKAQWVQLRCVMTAAATTPTYCRIKEFRIRTATTNEAFVAALQNARL